VYGGIIHEGFLEEVNEEVGEGREMERQQERKDKKATV
jgi:hypothetical protein